MTTQAIGIATTATASVSVAQQTAVATRRKRSSIVAFNLPPNSATTYAFSGDRFQLLSSPCPLGIRYDDTAGWFTINAGFGLTISTEAPFDRLDIQNPLSVAAPIVLFFGFDELTAAIIPTFPVLPVEGFLALTGAVQPLSSVPIYFTDGFFYGLNADPFGAAGSNNAAVVNIGKSANLPDIIQPGGWVRYQAPQGKLFNLANFKCLGAAADGVFWSLA